MLSLDLARRLRAAGLRWTPAAGDRFVLPDRGMDEDVFVISDMTVDVHEFPTGRVIGFNGVTEWALDSVDQTEALWMPSEDQLRHLLAGTFVRLERTGGEHAVTIRVVGELQRFVATDAGDAYGRALLHVLDEVRDAQ